jgi:methyltransferase (TIGR00027 family)
MVVAPRTPSRTAVLTAAARALHRAEPPPWVLDDDLGLRLAGAEGRALAERLRAELSGPELLGFCRWMCARARLAEDVVERASAAGVRQYAILGAGLDSFAYRRPDLVARVRVFEVDHPATQAWKRRRLTELAIPCPANLVYAPVDFERQTLRAGLEAAGFDFAAPAVFAWIGVTMYLTREAIRATLATIAACQVGTRVVLTYNLPRAALRGPGRAMEATMTRLVAGLGEPWISRFEPAEIAGLLRELGFAEMDDLGPEEATRAYFAGRAGVRLPGNQRVIEAAVAEHRAAADPSSSGRAGPRQPGSPTKPHV